MKVVVSGGSGFIGSAVVRHRLERGDEVVVISRRPASVTVGRGVGWDGPQFREEVATADAVINLAGENIARGRWSEDRKEALRESRLRSTEWIVGAFRTEPGRRRVLINASAIGYYGSRGNEVLTEDSQPGFDFLSKLTRDWESAARTAQPLARVVILRFGIVLGTDGGALPRMMLPFKLFAGGRIGRGDQWMSWIDRDDVVGLIDWALRDPAVEGVFNATAPAPVTNAEFTRRLASALHRPAILPVPPFALRLVLGEMAGALLLASQRVVPGRALEAGYSFRYAELDDSLGHLL
ncbi:MAG TPA: TIGR01777 family oxidoreductase [Thermoanaerobaculia bacterium]|nr:TIGR01777 family oxidoreductase [Thermoanaerobaculia bacterium]